MPGKVHGLLRICPAASLFLYSLRWGAGGEQGQGEEQDRTIERQQWQLAAADGRVGPNAAAPALAPLSAAPPNPTHRGYAYSRVGSGPSRATS